jgi:hypothetical protein
MIRRRTVFDEALVDSLDEVLETPNEHGRLIFLHTMATHFPYCGAVSEDFVPTGLDYGNPAMDVRFYGQTFRNLQQNLTLENFADWLAANNCYDRAVSYIDRVVFKVINRLEQQDEPGAVLFLADHGEAPILGSGHEPRLHSHFHVEIPFILWMNETYKSQRRDIAIAPDRRASLSDLSWTIADLAGISGLEATKVRSITSPGYVEVDRTTMNGDVGYDIFDAEADHVERARANLLALGTEAPRIWSHRVNSGGKMMVAKELFQGLEMDLVFDSTSNRFSIHHPPAPDVGLTLEIQLAQDTFGRKYWLDWKNALKSNARQALQRLEQLHEQYDLKSRTLVEISTLDGSSQVFINDGWQVSYYLPTEVISTCIESCSEEDALRLAKTLWQNYADNGFTAVSFDAHLLPFIDRYLSHELTEKNIPAYTWAIDIDISGQGAPEYLQPLLGRPWLKSILVTFPSQFHL